MSKRTAGNSGTKKAEPAVREADVISFLKEKGAQAKVRDESRMQRANVLALGRNEVFFQQLEDVAAKAFAGKIVPKGLATKKAAGKQSRILNLMLSDLHFGSALDGKDSRTQYGPHEEARRLAAVVKQVTEYKREHRNDTALVVHLLGDIIENQLHDPRVGEPLAAQTCAAIFLLSQAIGLLAAEFKTVTVKCSPGNHGRFKSRHPERAVFQKWDSLETVIYFALKQAVSSLKNVKVEIPTQPYYVAEQFGMGVFATHGDTVLRPGNPGKNINVADVSNQVANLKSTLDADGVPLKLFLCGHVHVPSIVYLNGGEVFMTNGALVPANSYSGTLGILKSVCGQSMWETVPSHIVGDYRFITVDESTDKDRSLEGLIKPFTGLA